MFSATVAEGASSVALEHERIAEISAPKNSTWTTKGV